MAFYLLWWVFIRILKFKFSQRVLAVLIKDATGVLFRSNINTNVDHRDSPLSNRMCVLL